MRFPLSRLVAAAILVTAFLAFNALPARAESKTLLAELERRTASITTVRGKFTQVTAIPMFTQPVVSTGQFAFRRPGSIRWEYETPMREGIALNGDAGFRWEDDPANRTAFTVQSDPLAAVIARQLVTWITFDAERIATEYGITALSTEPLTLRMTPKRSDITAIIARITIVFRADGTASRVEIEEQAGGKTSIEFGEPAVNAAPGTAGFVGDGDFR